MFGQPSYMGGYGSYLPSYYPQSIPGQMAQMQGQQTGQMGQMNQMGQMQGPAPAQTQSQSSGGINWVQGEEGAKAYMVAAGNTVLLMDSEGSSFYLKSTDQSGMPQPLRIFDYTERTAPAKAPIVGTSALPGEYVTRAEFEALEARLDAVTAKRPAKTKEPAKEATDE